MTLEEALAELDTHGKTCKCLSKSSCEWRENNLWQVVRDIDAQSTPVTEEDKLHETMKNDGWDIRDGREPWYIKRGRDWHVQILSDGTVNFAHKSRKSIPDALKIANAILETQGETSK